MKSPSNALGQRRRRTTKPAFGQHPSDTLHRLFMGLRDEVRSTKHNARFEEARGRHASFAEHETVTSVLAVLSDRHERRDEKDRLTRAVITEWQAGQSAFWGSVALVGFYPILRRLRRRMRGHGLADDLDQLVVTSFLGAVAEYPVDVYRAETGRRIQEQTERQVARSLCAEEDELRLFRTTREENEPARRPYARGTGARALACPFDLREVLSILLERMDDHPEAETYRLVVTTLLLEERILHYFDGAPSELDPLERRRAHKRAKRRQGRIRRRVEEALDHDDGGSMANGYGPKKC